MKVAVYGSLRREMHNDGFMRNAKLLGVETIYGYDMYSLGSYPFITEGEGKVIVEVYEISADDLQPIRRMEIGAGYVETTTNTQFGEAAIYVYPPELHHQYERRGRLGEKVELGDWKQYYNGELATSRSKLGGRI